MAGSRYDSVSGLQAHFDNLATVSARDANCSAKKPSKEIDSGVAEWETPKGSSVKHTNTAKVGSYVLQAVLNKTFIASDVAILSSVKAKEADSGVEEWSEGYDADQLDLINGAVTVDLLSKFYPEDRNRSLPSDSPLRHERGSSDLCTAYEALANKAMRNSGPDVRSNYEALVNRAMRDGGPDVGVHSRFEARWARTKRIVSVETDMLVRPACPGYPPERFDEMTIEELRHAFHRCQKKYPGNAALFVGNLPSEYSDEQLTRMLLKTFTHYGKVFASVYRRLERRVPGGRVIAKPGAVLQFKHEYDAKRALHQRLARGNGIGAHLIGSRPVRVEKSTAPRFVYVSQLDGGFVDVDRILATLEHYGRIEYHHLYHEGGMYKGMHARFRCYGSFQDAKRSLGSGRGATSYQWGNECLLDHE